jgi:hypothetical protein
MYHKKHSKVFFYIICKTTVKIASFKNVVEMHSWKIGSAFIFEQSVDFVLDSKLLVSTIQPVSVEHV